ncbi:MAG TPA: sulfate ABC transporter substrate-binding protein [Pirellulales bacterium]|jgi:sulfate transport system substrate-binding protein|nr:sulfate ABC transporter substrate-binding protein [Pirellulales bacterium]
MLRIGRAHAVVFLLPFSMAAMLVGTAGCGGSNAGSAASGGSSSGSSVASAGEVTNTTAGEKTTNTGPVELLNVACDPTRELWQDINEEFAKIYQRDTGRSVTIKQSHGGSSSQARAVNDGLEADVVTLAMWPDTDSIRRSGLIAEGWEKRLPENSLPYYSTIVFVVRKGNPKQIHDWPDLVKPDVQIITPHPKTSGNGKLSFLAAWGSVITRGGSEAQAKEFLTKLYQQTPVLDVAARSATMTFSKKGIGDVHLTWENEGQQEVQDSHGELEIVYPPVSIRAEPHVAWVDENVKKHGTTNVAQAYLEFLYTPVAQQMIAKHFYRPNSEGDRQKFADRFPPIKLFGITAVAKDWDDACQKFFNDGALFDQISEKK